MNHTVPHHEPARAPVLRQSQSNGQAGAGASHEQIAKLAHEIYVKGGSKEGDCQQNWLQAEKELRQLHQERDAEQVMQNEGGSSSTSREIAAEATTGVHAASAPAPSSPASAVPVFIRTNRQEA